MDYTKIYRNVYSAVKTQEIPHQLAHNVSIRIAEAVGDLYKYEKENDIISLPNVEHLIKKFWPTED
jgi:hypothetical protein